MSHATRCSMLRFAAASLAFLLVAPVQAQFLFGRIVPAPPATQPDNYNDTVDVSANGLTVVFSSAATNWVPGVPDTNDKAIAVDLATDAIEIVSRTEGGVVVRGESPAVSRDGRYVAFLTRSATIGGTVTTNWQVARKDRVTGTLVLASTNASGQQGDAHVGDDYVAISGDGNLVAFAASSPNFGIVTNGYEHIWVKNMTTGALTLASVHNNGTPAERGCAMFPNSMSDNGRFVVMTCDYEIVAGAGRGHAYVRDLVAGTSELVSRASGNGAPSSAYSNYPAISANGRFVTFTNPSYGGLGGNAATHSGIYMRDRNTGSVTSLPTPAGANAGGCTRSDVSDAGTVLMTCQMGSISQVYLHVPGAAGTPFLVSSNALDQPGNASSGGSVAVNASGQSYLFESLASNLVPGDTNDRSDIFGLVDPALVYGLFSDGFED